MPSPPFDPSTEAAMLPGYDTELADPTPGPITGERAAPSLANQWTHHTGETSNQPAPSHWRATVTIPVGRW